MNLVIDHGNTRIKAGLFQEERLLETFSFPDKNALQDFLTHHHPENLIICSVAGSADEILSWAKVGKNKWMLHSALPLPITIGYETPATLGTDRIAAVCGALLYFPGGNCLVIDAGTCITYEFLDHELIYRGGSISPGIKMRFRALHTFTARLPLVEELEKEIPLTGATTETSILSGVVNGATAEIKGMIEKYRHQYPNLGVILCGGDHYLFENQLKPSIFVAPELVLKGLNRILLHNAGLQ